MIRGQNISVVNLLYRLLFKSNSTHLDHVKLTVTKCILSVLEHLSHILIAHPKSVKNNAKCFIYLNILNAKRNKKVINNSYEKSTYIMGQNCF